MMLNLEPYIGRILLYFGEEAGLNERRLQIVREFGFGTQSVVIKEPTLQDGSPEKIASLVGGLEKPNSPQTDPSEQFFEIVGIFDPQQPSTKTYSQLIDQIKSGKIDQKYLYWDAPAALRWEEITDGTQYLTATTTMNFLAVRGNEIVKDFISSVTDKEKIDVSFINLGVGTGFKDAVILASLLQDERVDNVRYFAVDDSLPMIQVTIPNIIKGFYGLKSEQRQRTTLRYVLTAFEKLDAKLVRYVRGVEATESKKRANGENQEPNRRVRLIGLLGGSLGNFREDQIISTIRDQLMQSKGDTLLLGTELIANRRKDELIANYSDHSMKKFLFGPIQDVIGIHVPYDKFKYKVFPDDGPNYYSVVEGAKTIVGYVTVESHDVELFYSTKYSPEKLKRWLEEQHLEIVGTPFTSLQNPPLICKYLCRKS
jgi:uncharacterized SAM-dependent methyltransferase